MASDEPRPVKVQIPRNMRPRATPNAEINAQNRDQTLREMGMGYPEPPVKDVPPRGYKGGGKIKGSLFAGGGPPLPRIGSRHAKR